MEYKMGESRIREGFLFLPVPFGRLHTFPKAFYQMNRTI